MTITETSPATAETQERAALPAPPRGLAAVLGIVRGHKGALHITTEPGKGTCFKVFFPASARASRAPARRRSSPTPRTTRM